MTTVIQTCGVQPPPFAAAAEVTVPLSFFDMTWIHFHPTSHLIFYDHPCSEAEFLDAIVPNLKRSLSLAFKHYLPVAGNLLYPIDTEKSKPVIRYVSGDSAPLTVAVSSSDFDELVGSHPRDSDQFYEFSPPMWPLKEDSDHKIVPLIALQATLFPNRGICIGVANHHCLGDARSIIGFMWAWAEINKRGGGDDSLSEAPPLFDRSVFGDCSEVNEVYWNAVRRTPLDPPTFPLPTNRVRASFTLHRSDIDNLKALALSKNPHLLRISSFVVTAAYAWSCLVKSGGGGGGGGGGMELFTCSADARGRRNALVDPPPPENYFGNCLGVGGALLEREKVAAEDGFVAAAAAIAGMIETQINDGDNFLKASDNWLSRRKKAAEISKLGVTGSPKFDLSRADFGWGKGRRVEVLSIDGDNHVMSVYNSWDSAGGLVVGFSLPRERMDAFAAIFQDALPFLIKNGSRSKL